MDETHGSIANRKKTILIIDDDSAVLSFLAQALARDGYHILTANNGSDGLQKSREFRNEIHLVLSDFRMPGMSGVDVAITLTDERPNLKVLLISGFADEVPVNEEWYLLAKPFVPSQLRALVANIFGLEA